MRAREFIYEAVESYGGIDFDVEIERDEEGEDIDNIYVKALSNGRELGHVLFTISYDSEGMVLNPQDLEVDERYRGQGIASTMYDYMQSKGYKIRRSGQQTDAGAGLWDKYKPGKNIWEQGVAEAKANGYKEIEFVCANPEFCDATDPELQKQMYIGLKKIPGVIPLLQDWDEYSEGQKSLVAIYKSRESKQKILALAKQLGVSIDLEQPVSDEYVDRAIRGEHEGQQGVAENNAVQDFIHGDCPIYAIALHELSGLPLMAMLDYSDEIDKTVLVHAFVMHNNKVIDAEGYKTIDDIEDEFPIENEAEVVNITPKELIKIGYDGVCPPKQQAIQHAKKLLKSLNLIENFADGKVKGKSRPGRVERSGASCKGSVTSLRAKARKYSGEKAKMYHWCANMKGGRKNK